MCHALWSLYGNQNMLRVKVTVEIREEEMKCHARYITRLIIKHTKAMLSLFIFSIYVIRINYDVILNFVCLYCLLLIVNDDNFRRG